MPQTSESNIEYVRRLLSRARRLCVLTGAGISAESGLQTFRDAGGLWDDHPVEKVATPEGFARDPELVWRFYNARRKAAHSAAPNAAHLAVARLEVGMARGGPKPVGLGKTGGNGNGKHPGTSGAASFTLLTQNIDGLHQQAGSRHVVELHGSIWKVRCTECGLISSDFPIELPILPKCVECKGLLRPHVVWFGEMLDPEVQAESESAALSCDFFLVIGTSAVVQPAASYPLLAARRGIPVVEVNKETTPLSAVAAVSLLGPAGELLPKLVR